MQTPISVSNPKTSKGPMPPPSPSGRHSRGKREHNAGIKRHEIKMPFGEKDERAGDLKGKYRFGAEEGGLERPFKPGL